MKMLALVLLSVLAAPAVALADTSYFVSNGLFNDGGTFSGTFSISSTTGKVDGGSFTFNTSSFTGTMTDNYFDYPTFDGYDEADFKSSDGNSFFFLRILTGPPVALCTLSNDALCTTNAARLVSITDPLLEDAVSGDITFDINGVSVPQPPAVPEPSSLALLGTGALGLVSAAQRRVRRAHRY